MKKLAHPFVALYFGAFLLCALTSTHLDDIVSMPISVVNDYAAGILLIAGSIVARRNWTEGRPFQIAAWAFMTSLLFSSVLGDVQDRLAHAADVAPVDYAAIKVAMLLMSIAGLAGSLTARTLSTPRT